MTHAICLQAFGYHRTHVSDGKSGDKRLTTSRMAPEANREAGSLPGSFGGPRWCLPPAEALQMFRTCASRSSPAHGQLVGWKTEREWAASITALIGHGLGPAVLCRTGVHYSSDQRWTGPYFTMRGRWPSRL